MTLPRPVKFCPICAAKLEGRRDKIFCTPVCKAEYHRKRQKQHLPFSYPIDSILHRNWVILTEFYEEIGKSKFFLPMSTLEKSGFHFNYFTTRIINSKDKEYFYVYNYGWMLFSDKEVMIIRLSHPK